jgi:hypothetical protein
LPTASAVTSNKQKAAGSSAAFCLRERWGVRQSVLPILAQLRAQRRQLRFVVHAARGILAQWLAHLRGAGSTQYGAWGLVKVEAGRVEV